MTDHSYEKNFGDICSYQKMVLAVLSFKRFESMNFNYYFPTQQRFQTESREEILEYGANFAHLSTKQAGVTR